MVGHKCYFLILKTNSCSILKGYIYGRIANEKGVILLFLKFFSHTLRVISNRSCISLSTVFLVFSIVFLIQIPNAFPAQLTVGWDENTETNIAGYKLYYGTSSGNYTNTVDAGLQTEYTLTNLQEGVTYFFCGHGLQHFTK